VSRTQPSTLRKRQKKQAEFVSSIGVMTRRCRNCRPGPPVRDRVSQPHHQRAVVEELRPVEVHVALAVLSKKKPLSVSRGDEAGGGLARRHGMRVGVEEGPVHRVHQVVVDVAPGRLPVGVAAEGAIRPPAELLGGVKAGVACSASPNQAQIASASSKEGRSSRALPSSAQPGWPGTERHGAVRARSPRRVGAADAVALVRALARAAPRGAGSDPTARARSPSRSRQRTTARRGA
jgi:hypothetical protein